MRISKAQELRIGDRIERNGGTHTVTGVAVGEKIVGVATLTLTFVSDMYFTVPVDEEIFVIKDADVLDSDDGCGHFHGYGECPDPDEPYGVAR